MKHTFYKEDGNWFIHLKWFPKSLKHHLALVAGADELLELESGAQELNRGYSQEDAITLKISTKQFEGFDNVLIRKVILPSYLMGAIYFSANKQFKNETIKDNHLWLCWVTLLVFGRYPKNIYYQKL